MREIRFRAWDKVFKKMLVAGDSNLPDLTCNGCPVEPHTRKNLSMEMELMQFTGLLDKSGKEIYEGDIVKICGWYDWKTNPDRTFREPIEVKWSEDEGKWDMTFSPRCGYEVIGNIYEHSHLLKGESNEAK